MYIEYYGHSCFLIKGSTTVVTDPFDGIGYDLPYLAADYVLSSHAHFDHNAFHRVSGTVKVPYKCGKEENSPIDLEGILTCHDDKSGKLRGSNVVYKFKVDGITFMHLGDLGENVSDGLVTRLGTADVVFVPVGGTYTIDYKEAFKLVSLLKPRVVIPMHFKTSRSTVNVDGVDKFLSLCDSYEKVSGRLAVDRALLEGENKVVLMDRPDF